MVAGAAAALVASRCCGGSPSARRSRCCARRTPSTRRWTAGQPHARAAAAGQALQSQPKQGYDESMRQLEEAVRQRLGTSARMTHRRRTRHPHAHQHAGRRARQWLTQVRTNARALPGEAAEPRASGGWDGTIVLTLPAR
jgi:hypothetical protein